MEIRLANEKDLLNLWEETDNIRLYKRMGFTEKIKDSFVDPCNVDEKQMPNSCEKIWLLGKNL
ncbi:hypothetical protein [Clostridium hydrogenum]|uniref:hypothetical protein n=1 Tax=Clostridium hydrogenum TaxID=2855764 RepID=UPI001F39F50B|nr:hypothetical protein [Clostridium hydrogenum]